jgi:hypothetical protein
MTMYPGPPSELGDGSETIPELLYVVPMPNPNLLGSDIIGRLQDPYEYRASAELHDTRLIWPCG